jgi:predicted O-methyltransferase YrrM
VTDEPTTREEVAAWIATHRVDPFDEVRRASHEHRERHGAGCSVYPTNSGPLLGVLAAATRAQRVLELGCGLGYSALWLASAGAHVETIERDPGHAELARENAARHGAADRIVVHVGLGEDLLASLDDPYDLVFEDGDPFELDDDFEHFVRLLRPGGLLVSANLFLGQYVPDLPDLPVAARYRQRLLEDERLLTSILADGLALSVRRS